MRHLRHLVCADRSSCSANRLSAFSFLTPLFGVAAGHLVLGGDPLTPAFAAAVALVATGLVFWSIGRDELAARQEQDDETGHSGWPAADAARPRPMKYVRAGELRASSEAISGPSDRMCLTGRDIQYKYPGPCRGPPKVSGVGVFDRAGYGPAIAIAAHWRRPRAPTAPRDPDM